MVLLYQAELIVLDRPDVWPSPKDRRVGVEPTYTRLVRNRGFEPRTNRLRVYCSTVELVTHVGELSLEAR